MKFWIAKDKNGSIFIFDGKPVKEEIEWKISQNLRTEYGGYEIPKEWVKKPLSWEDEEPTEINIVEASSIVNTIKSLYNETDKPVKYVLDKLLFLLNENNNFIGQVKKLDNEK